MKNSILLHHRHSPRRTRSHQTNHSSIAIMRPVSRVWAPLTLLTLSFITAVKSSQESSEAWSPRTTPLSSSHFIHHNHQRATIESRPIKSGHHSGHRTEPENGVSMANHESIVNEQSFTTSRALATLMTWKRVLRHERDSSQEESTPAAWNLVDSLAPLSHEPLNREENDSDTDVDLVMDPEHIDQLRDHIQLMANKAYRIERICYAFAYGLIIVLSFFGNLLVCRVCLQNMTRTNALIMSLAASDLLMTIFNIPFNYFRIAHYSWPFGTVMCFLVNYVQHLVVYISSYTMAIIAIQRYQSISGLNITPSSSSSTKRNRNSFKHSSSMSGGHSFSCSFNEMVDQLARLGGAIKTGLCTLLCACRQSGGNRKLFSMRAIYMTIAVIWFVSALISALFTYNSTVVASKDVLYVILSEMYRGGGGQSSGGRSNMSSSQHWGPTANRTNMPVDTYLNDGLGEASLPVAHHSNVDDTDMSGSILNGHPDEDVMLRCQNPIPANMEQVLASVSINIDFAKSITVFITQYFIPLTISCCLYIRIGKIISHQGKLANVRGE